MASGTRLSARDVAEELKSSTDVDPVTLNNKKTYDYGFGWGQPNQRSPIEHGGAWQGFASYIGRFVDDKLTVIVFDNLAECRQDRRHVPRSSIGSQGYRGQGT
jgi:hypothetical protein